MEGDTHSGGGGVSDTMWRTNGQKMATRFRPRDRQKFQLQRINRVKVGRFGPYFYATIGDVRHDRTYISFFVSVDFLLSPTAGGGRGAVALAVGNMPL